MSLPVLSVVVPVHNAVATLSAQLDALIATSFEGVEIVVVDNRSSDGSGALARAWADRSPRVRVVDAADKASEGHARNVGVAAASSDRIAFCDADDVVGTHWIEAMAAGLQDAAYVTGPVDLDAINPPWLAAVRGRRLFESLPLLFDEVPFAHGCNFGATRATIARVGGFREDMPAGMDIEFAVRVWRAGVTLAWLPTALVQYRHRLSSRDRWNQSRSYGRAQPQIRRLLPEVEHGNVAWGNARRIAWLASNAVGALRERELRARWTWTLGLVIGELEGATSGGNGRR